MNQRLLLGLGIFGLVALVALFGALFTVYQSQQALVLQFGNPVRVIRDPGLHAKLPFIQQVEFFDKRVLDFDAPSVELVLGDQKRIVVDAFARYRITDPLRFRQSSGNEVAFRSRLEPIVFSTLRSVMGEVSLFTVLSEERLNLMNRIRAEANRSLERFGVEVVDIRIKRADLPEENSQAIFRRMQTEREREARELRAQGGEIAQRIRSRADRERRVLIAEAEKQSQIRRGEGDALAIDIFAQSFGKDEDFFSFYRSMQAYREALADGATSYVLSPSSDFFRYFDTPNSAMGRQAPPGGGDGLASGPASAPGNPLPADRAADPLVPRAERDAGTALRAQ